MNEIRAAAGTFIRLEFKPGAFWRVDLWICLLPMLPIHIHWWLRAVPADDQKPSQEMSE